MSSAGSRLLAVAAFAVLTVPAFADDCTTVKSAMLHSGRTPHSLIITGTDARGKSTVTRQVQTVDNKFVQTPDGKWYAMNIAIKDLNEDLSQVLACHRSGSEIIAGESTAVYEVHMNLDGSPGDSKVWVSQQNLILKSEQVSAGKHYSTQYDFAHAAPPTNVISPGGK